MLTGGWEQAHQHGRLCSDGEGASSRHLAPHSSSQRLQPHHGQCPVAERCWALRTVPIWHRTCRLQLLDRPIVGGHQPVAPLLWILQLLDHRPHRPSGSGSRLPGSRRGAGGQDRCTGQTKGKQREGVQRRCGQEAAADGGAAAAGGRAAGSAGACLGLRSRAPVFTCLQQARRGPGLAQRSAREASSSVLLPALTVTASKLVIDRTDDHGAHRAPGDPQAPPPQLGRTATATSTLDLNLSICCSGDWQPCSALGLASLQITHDCTHTSLLIGLNLIYATHSAQSAGPAGPAPRPCSSANCRPGPANTQHQAR